MLYKGSFPCKQGPFSLTALKYFFFLFPEDLLWCVLVWILWVYPFRLARLLKFVVYVFLQIREVVATVSSSSFSVPPFLLLQRLTSWTLALWLYAHRSLKFCLFLFQPISLLFNWKISVVLSFNSWILSSVLSILLLSSFLESFWCLKYLLYF